MSTRRSTRSLTLDQIVDAAMELLERDGLGAVTIRAVAERLGVGAMTLYTYVGTKEGLLAAIASRHLESVAFPGPDLPWRERIVGTFRVVHDLFAANPELAGIAASQSIDEIGAFRGAEVVLGALREAGLSDQRAIEAFDALASYLTGFALREAARLTNPVPPASRLREIQRLPEDEFPHVRALSRPFVARDPSFDRGLAFLVDGIVAEATTS